MNWVEKKKRLVTYALPYANGSLHLGHALGLSQTDCYVRALRLMGEDVTFVCGDDAHGTPIMLNARKNEISPEQLVETIFKEHCLDIEQLSISVDTYHTTHCQLNEDIVHAAYHRLYRKGYIITKNIKQAYDETCSMFLPDRYIKGDCPKCGAGNQYGDCCEVCGKTYAMAELKNPKSTMSNATPVLKETEHYFYALSKTQAIIKKWLHQALVPESVKNKLSEWFGGLHDWDISRDAPYFGIKIPNTEHKYFYVWLDAPFGYLSALGAELGTSDAETVLNAWNTYQVEHFVGKDIVYFHGVFWPSVLSSCDLVLPHRLHVHGFLNISGDKMSKSRGTFILLQDYLAIFPPDLLRYYFASRLSSSVADVDFNATDFMLKTNADLVGKLVNIGNRLQGFLHQHYSGILGEVYDVALWQLLISADAEIQQAYRDVDLAAVCRQVMLLCDQTNQYINDHKPWEMAKKEEKEVLLKVCTTGLNAFRYLVYRLAPIVPNIAEHVANSFNESIVWDIEPLINHRCEPFKHLVSRVTKEQIDRL